MTDNLSFKIFAFYNLQ